MARIRSLLLQSRYGLALIVLLVFLVVSLLTRVGLMLLLARESVATEGAWQVLRALGVGERFDLVVSLWLVTPWVAYLTLLPERWLSGRVQQVILWSGTAASVFTALFVAVAEFFFFEEFSGRFNFVAVDYLIYPTEVVSNVWESYHTAWWVAAIAAATAGAMWALRRPVRRALGSATTPRQRVAFSAVFALLLCSTTAAVSPSAARVSDDRELNELASNGYYSFWEALLGQDAPYEGLYATRGADAVFARLRTLLAEPATDAATFAARSTLRRVRALEPARRFNVVVVLEESLGADFVGAMHPGAGTLTPSYDSLAAEGTLLTRAYSTGNRTIRALETTTSSLPPLPGVSIVRRPGSHDLFTLPALLRSRGYATEFIYGGRAMFDGMRGYMLGNGVERVVEQRDYPKGTFTTAWGVCDEAIFDKALAEMDSLHSTGRPFYTLILTVSNHRPYTYPPGRIAADPRERRRRNAVQYADYALGRFMRQARGHAFFDSTLFVLMGDHGARVYGAQEIPLGSYEVPILFYAPALVPAGRRVGTLASSMDVAPTILGLLGQSYESRFFGRDVLHQAPSEGRAVMTHNSEVALLRDSTLAVLGLRETAEVYRYHAASRALTRVARPDSAERALVEDAIAYFDGADIMYRGGGYHAPLRVLAGTPR